MPTMSRKRRRVFLHVALLALLIAGCEKGTPPAKTPVEVPVSNVPEPEVDVSVEEAKAILDANDGYVYLDVRTVAEFTAGHVPGSLNIPFLVVTESGGRESNAEFLATAQAALSKDAKIIVGCRSGSRSKRAKGAMKSAGYTHLCEMLGGFVGTNEQPGWSSLGYPVEAGDGGENSYATLRAKAAP